MNFVRRYKNVSRIFKSTGRNVRRTIRISIPMNSRTLWFEQFLTFLELEKEAPRQDDASSTPAP